MDAATEAKIKELSAAGLKLKDFFDEKELKEISKAKEDPDKVFNKRRTETATEDKGRTHQIDYVVNKTAENDAEREMQGWNDDLYIVSKLMSVKHPHLHPRQLGLYRRFSETTLAKAMSLASGAGSQWIPTGFSSELQRRVALEAKVAGLFKRFPMPTSPYTWPLESAGVTVYKASEQQADVESATAITASTPTTDNTTFTAAKPAGRTCFSEEISEDSIVPVLPYLKEEFAQAMAEAIDNCIINGDTARTLDVGVGTTDVRACWSGLRKYAAGLGSDNRVDMSTFNHEKLMEVVREMDKYGVIPAKLAILVSNKGLYQLRCLVDNSTNARLLTTADKYGPNAPFVSGEVGKIDGIPVVVSEYVNNNLNASGVYDGTTTTKSVLVVVFHPAWKIGDRRKFTLKTDENIRTDQTEVVVTQRLDFQHMLASGQETVGTGYNF